MARREVSIDSTVKETVRAKLRLCVSRILLEGGGCPPSGQEAATQSALQQAELLCAGWA